MYLFHADDYGVNKNQAKRILNCYRRGVLRSVSIIPNSPRAAETIALLPDDIKKSIHLNLVEGTCVSDPSKIPLLADPNGKFRRSFFQLVLLSVCKRKELRRQAAIECGAQITKMLALLPDGYKIRIDSHRHYNMIPAVFEAVCAECKKSGRQMEYLRFPLERLSVYLLHPGLYKYIRPVNVIKILVLKICSIKDKKIAKTYGMDAGKADFIGLMQTTQMNLDYVLSALRLLNRHKDYKKSDDLEVLFHPGGIKMDEEFMDADNQPMKAFYTSKNRWMEAETLKELKAYECPVAGAGERKMKAEFDAIAENYSELMKQGMVLKGAGNDHAYFTAYKMYYLKEYIKKCRQKNSRKAVKILDYGCGIGIVSRAIADTFANVIVHGFDISAESIKCANGIRHRKNVFFTSDADKLDQDYDLCICCCVLHHVPKKGRDAVVRDIYKRLKARGGGYCS